MTGKNRWLIAWTLLVGFGALAAPPTPSEESYICIEASTGLVLAEHNADVVRPPASMVKMMLMLLVAEGLENGSWTLDQVITVSPEAERTDGSQVYLRTGEQWTLGQLMQAVAVASANDAALAVAEGLWGSKAAYLEASNARAQELGMWDSKFYSVHGLPPEPGETYDETTARDMVILARQCIEHPTIMQWVGQRELYFRPNQAPKSNTNKLLWQMPGCDGLKTGYTLAAGWCLTATAQRDGLRLIAVTMGSNNKAGRFNTAQHVLESGFAGVSRLKVLAKGQPMETAVPVANCTSPSVQLTAADDVYAIVPVASASQIEVVTQQPQIIQAPQEAGTVLGQAQVVLNGRTLSTVPLTVPTRLEAAGWKWKLQQSVRRAGALRRTKEAKSVDTVGGTVKRN